MAIDGTADYDHQLSVSDDSPRLTETEDMLRRLGLDDGSMDAIKTIADEIIGEHTTPSMPWPVGLGGLTGDKENHR